jgi:NADH:ubiquinone oxidoreductase subunit E
MIKYIKEKTGLEPGKTTSDMKLTLECVNCVGACGLAPVVIINEKYNPEAELSLVSEFIEQVKAE